MGEGVGGVFIVRAFVFFSCILFLYFSDLLLPFPEIWCAILGGQETVNYSVFYSYFQLAFHFYIKLVGQNY